jgi:hypothetical protein
LNFDSNADPDPAFKNNADPNPISWAAALFPESVEYVHYSILSNEYVPALLVHIYSLAELHEIFINIQNQKQKKNRANTPTVRYMLKAFLKVKRDRTFFPLLLCFSLPVLAG